MPVSRGHDRICVSGRRCTAGERAARRPRHLRRQGWWAWGAHLHGTPRRHSHGVHPLQDNAPRQPVPGHHGAPATWESSPPATCILRGTEDRQPDPAYGTRPWVFAHGRQPCTLHPAPCTLTLYHAHGPHTIHPPTCTLHLAPCTQVYASADYGLRTRLQPIMDRLDAGLDDQSIAAQSLLALNGPTCSQPHLPIACFVPRGKIGPL